MSSIVQNDTSPIIIYMVLSSDHVTPATGKTVTMNLSKAGAAFAAGGGTMTELSNGFYKYVPVTADVGTLGDLAERATASGCDDWVDVRRVVQAGAAASDWTSARAAKVDNLDATVSSRLADADYVAPLDAAGVRGAVGLAAANLDTQLGALPSTSDTDAISAAIAALNDVSAADILAAVIETNGATTITVLEALQLAAAIPAGTVAGILSGAGNQTFTVKSASGQDFLSIAGDELGNRVVTRSDLT